MKKLLFVIIAQRDVKFFISVANKLKTKYEISFLSFYEPAEKLLKKNSFKYFVVKKSFFDNIHTDLNKIKQLEKKFKFNFNDFKRHEKLTFNIDDQYLIKKTIIYFDLISSWIREYQPDAIYQELGGFIGPLSIFYIARKFNVDHYFFEPMVFEKTLGCVKNNLSYTVSNKKDINGKKFMRSYLEKYHNKKITVIPIKDKHHFKNFLLLKYCNFNNLYLLLTKIYYKYIAKKHQEYDHILNHCVVHLSRILNRNLIKKFYVKPDFNAKLSKYIFFPFHVPADYSLTVRNPIYLNQIDLLIKIQKYLPNDIEIWVKEHPAAIGAYKPKQIKKLISNPNFKIIDPNINSYDLIKGSECVLTINSKVGVEALMQKKKVIVIGNSYYSKKGLVQILDNFKLIKNLLYKDLSKSFDQKLEIFLVNLKKYSFDCELYVNSNENILSFSQMIDKSLKNKLYLK